MWSASLRQSINAGVLQNPMMTRNLLRQQNALLRMYPAAGFAKYNRNKPHLNVGTIGKCFIQSQRVLLCCPSQSRREKHAFESHHSKLWCKLFNYKLDYRARYIIQAGIPLR